MVFLRMEAFILNRPLSYSRIRQFFFITSRSVRKQNEYFPTPFSPFTMKFTECRSYKDFLTSPYQNVFSFQPLFPASFSHFFSGIKQVSFWRLPPAFLTSGIPHMRWECRFSFHKKRLHVYSLPQQMHMDSIRNSFRRVLSARRKISAPGT